MVNNGKNPPPPTHKDLYDELKAIISKFSPKQFKYFLFLADQNPPC